MRLSSVKVEKLSPKVYGLTITGLCFNPCRQFRKATEQLSKQLDIKGNVRLLCMGRYGLVEILER